MATQAIVNHAKTIIGSKFCSIGYFTDCRFPKKSGLQNVKKYVEIKSAQFNYSFANAVKNRAEKAVGHAVNFVPQSLPFGSWVKGLENKIIEYKGEYYLRFYLQKNDKVSVTYFENGIPCDSNRVAEIKAYLATKGSKTTSGTQAAVGLTENQVEPKNVKVSNIVYFTCNGTTIRNGNVMQTAG